MALMWTLLAAVTVSASNPSVRTPHDFFVLVEEAHKIDLWDSWEIVAGPQLENNYE